VPVVAGAAIVPLLIAVTDQVSSGAGISVPVKRVAAAEADSSPPATPTVHLPTPQQQSGPKPELPTAQQAPPEAAQPSIAKPAPQKAREPHRPSFYATDADEERFPTSQVGAKKGDSIALHWELDPAAVTGEVHLRSENENNQTISDTIVENTGALKLTVSGPAKMVLTEIRPEGERFLADLEITIQN
jgi:hypothetical protein